MHNFRSYYSSEIKEFLHKSEAEILGIIHKNVSSAETTIQQNTTWELEISILKYQLANFTHGQIMFEYTIPRMGKRVDVIFLYKNIVFLLEFKCGDDSFKSSTYDQVYDYALDLQNFQKESHNKLLVPIMVSTKAPAKPLLVNEHNRIIEPIKCCSNNISDAIELVSRQYLEPAFDYLTWEYSEYLPTPTIVEAAQALYRGHNVADITRSDAGAENLTITMTEINKIIDSSRVNQRKSICFVTGVPGAGKTLVGLNIAIQRSDAEKGEHAVFLSGNYPLVSVLQEALARDKVEQAKKLNIKITKKDALRSTSAFIQIIHKYRDSFVDNANIPPERIVIFDEAQRAWTREKIASFMRTKKGIHEFDYSEPEFLISTMNRHMGWAVIICLVGGGQEINTGEAGLPEWFDSLRRAFPDWDVYITPQLDDEEFRRSYQWEDMIAGLNTYEVEQLHLSSSVRSFRTPDLASFVKAILDVDLQYARELLKNFNEKYPILITQDMNKAKDWIKAQCHGTTRYGLLASSGAIRLKPEGIFVKNDISVENWFLNGKDDVRSSYFLEDVVTEFDIQGLELDYSIVAWDADFRFNNNEWQYHNFKGNRWNNINSEDKRIYLKNAYRVLLTRARQGMIIFIPKGNDTDKTRLPEYYDGTYHYLKSVGISEI